MKNKPVEKKYRIVEIGIEDACYKADFLPIDQIGLAENLIVKENGYSTCYFYFDKPFKFYEDDTGGASRMCFWDVKVEEIQ